MRICVKVRIIGGLINILQMVNAGELASLCLETVGEVGRDVI